MKRAVHGLAKEALMAYPKNARTSWILQWPSQLVLNCSQASCRTFASAYATFCQH
jgi:dynein heavy chain